MRDGIHEQKHSLLTSLLKAFFAGLTGANRKWTESPKDKHGNYDLDGVSFDQDTGVVVAGSVKSATGDHIYIPKSGQTAFKH